MLKVDEHEKNISELSELLKVEGVDQAKVSTILQSLRENYTEVDTTILDTGKKIEELNGLNEGLRSANMGLLSKLGTQIGTLPKPNTNKEPEINPDDEGEKPLSLDDISKEFLK